MTHETTLERLDDFLDGGLTPREERDVRRHLMQCESCRAEETALRTLLEAAAELPEEIVPERDLWSGISARLEPRGELRVRQAAEAEAETAAIVIPLRRPRALPGWMQVAAAIVLVAGTALVTLQYGRGPAGTGAAPEAVAVATPPPADIALAAFQPAEREYRTAIDDLTRVLEDRREQLAPETVRVLEQNLRVIDEAIAESSAALAADPASPELTRMLADAYDAKLGVLRHAVQL